MVRNVEQSVSTSIVSKPSFKISANTTIFCFLRCSWRLSVPYVDSTLATRHASTSRSRLSPPCHGTPSTVTTTSEHQLSTKPACMSTMRSIMRQAEAISGLNMDYRTSYLFPHLSAPTIRGYPRTNIVKMSIDPKFVELTADVLKIFSYNLLFYISTAPILTTTSVKNWIKYTGRDMALSSEMRLRQMEMKSLPSYLKMTLKHVRSDSSTRFLILALAMLVIAPRFVPFWTLMFKDCCHYGPLCTRAYNILCFSRRTWLESRCLRWMSKVRNLKHLPYFVWSRCCYSSVAAAAASFISVIKCCLVTSLTSLASHSLGMLAVIFIFMPAIYMRQSSLLRYSALAFCLRICILRREILP